ncbi:MAG: 3-dehydroquinate dehydratase-2 [Candidatus Omnitrophota bacterium]|jgi:3-dehydroquinate dehydratase-2
MSNRITVIHGPNLDKLGTREPGVYGSVTLEQINSAIKIRCERLDLVVEFKQSNHEGEIVDWIGQLYGNGSEGLLINPAAYTHTSVAIRDAVAAAEIPTVEVHLSNVYAREEFRHKSLIAPVASGQISGFGLISYTLGVEALATLIQTGFDKAEESL